MLPCVEPAHLFADPLLSKSLVQARGTVVPPSMINCKISAFAVVKLGIGLRIALRKPAILLLDFFLDVVMVDVVLAVAVLVARMTVVVVVMDTTLVMAEEEIAIQAHDASLLHGSSKVGGPQTWSTNLLLVYQVHASSVDDYAQHCHPTHGTHGNSPQAHALAIDSPALSFDPSAWMVDVNCKSVGPDDGWTEVPYHHPTSHSIVHSPSVTGIKTSNLFLPLYSLMVGNCDDEDEDPTESPTVSPSCSDESTKPDPQYTIATHCRKSPCQYPPKLPPSPLQAPNQPAHTPSMGFTSRNALCLP